MKKTIRTIAMATLCLFLSGAAFAQTAALKIGDKVPDVTINNISNYKTSSAKLSDFKGKLLIIDFWATWCSPCIAMIPSMDSLQKVFGGQVQFVSVTYQDEKTVKLFKDKLQKARNVVYALPEAVSDKALHNLFPHSTLPHYVWIDEEGKLKATTGFEEVTYARIKEALQNSNSDLKQKVDVRVAYDYRKPLFINNNGGEWPADAYHTVFSSYRNGLSSGFSVQNADSTKSFRAVLRNTSLLWFYSMAYGEGGQYYGPKRIVVEVEDASKFRYAKTLTDNRENLHRWMEKNAFCYEIMVPAEMAGRAYQMMQQDFERLFPQYEARIEKRKVKCLVLSGSKESARLQSTGGKPFSQISGLGARIQNQSIDGLFATLDKAYLQNHPYPLVNESGITRPVDLVIDAPLSNVTAMNKELEKYGLKFIEEERMIDMLIINDNEKPISKLNQN